MALDRTYSIRHSCFRTACFPNDIWKIGLELLCRPIRNIISPYDNASSN